MAGLKLQAVTKSWDGKTQVIKPLTLDVADGEFIVMVGPSGCGKSTLLRMIAGLEDISSGELWVDGEIENYKEPRERNLAMVFQNYALYPNMSVYDNIAFSLSVRKVDKKEIKKKVYDMAKMRVELAALQHAVGTTTIYVTHDQTEAMTLGTRIVVMRDGKMQQVDTPANLYAKPVNRFVAGFIGTPSMNFFEAQVVSWEEAPALLVGEYRLMPCREDAARISRHGSDSVILGIRPENILWEAPECVSAGADYVEAMILEVELLGAEKLLFFLLYGKKYVAKIPAEYAARAGEVRRLYFDVTAIHLFDCDSEMRI